MEIVHARVCHGSHYKCTLHSEALFQLRLRPQFCRVHTWKNIRKEIGIKINHNLLELTYATFRWAFYGLFTGEKRLLKIMGFYDLFVTEIAFCLNKKKNTKSLADLTSLVPKQWSIWNKHTLCLKNVLQFRSLPIRSGDTYLSKREFNKMDR